MAERAYTQAEGAGGTHRTTWTGLLNGDTGAPISIPGAADRTVQVFGTFGTGGSVAIEGSCEETPTEWFPLKDAPGNDIALVTGNRGELIAENVTWIRPNVTGDGTTNLTCIILHRGLRG